MVVKSRGARKRTRHKLKGAPKFTVNMVMKDLKKGQKVALVANPRVQGGMPFKRFHGLTGVVKGRRGSSYVVEIKDQGKKKTVITRPEHLRVL